MATQAEKLLISLQVLSEAMGAPPKHIIRSKQISRTHRERLIEAGFLVEIIKGWLLVNDPTKRVGESTLWYGSFWTFLSVFFEERFGVDYCLSAEASIMIHTGRPTIPSQVTVITRRSSGQALKLPFETSLFLYKAEKSFPERLEQKNNFQIMTLAEAICRLPKSFYETYALEAQIALSLVPDASLLLYHLLKEGKTTTAGYLVGAYRHLGKKEVADRIYNTMKSSGHQIIVINPFVLIHSLLASSRVNSPYALRIEALWQSYRDHIAEAFSDISKPRINIEDYLKTIDKQYESDAYNSLSIEGYQVSEKLIRRVRDGKWNPDQPEDDQGQRDALAAKGYGLAYDSVRHSVKKVLKGENPGKVIRQDLSEWFLALFSPSVKAGLLEEYQLAGYRSHQVYIQNSRHVPFPPSALIDSMDMFFSLLETETHPIVRAILGHFVFVHIHPFGDGNGRIGRFLMNVMMASGGCPWVIIPVVRRSEYMEALEKASCDDSIEALIDFMGSLMLTSPLKFFS